MTYEQLRAFITVAQLGSFRAAAKALYKTQPSISAAVKGLEAEFAFSLFDRSDYRVRLTPEGKAFLAEAQQLVSSAHALEKLGHRLAAGVSPSLAICVSPVFSGGAGLACLSGFQKAFSDTRLSITTEHLKGVEAQLEQGKVELAISPYYGFSEQYEFMEVGRVEMITVVAASWLEGKGISHQQAEPLIKQSDLYALPHILIEDSSADPFDHVNVLPFGERWYVGDYYLKRSLLAAGMGWARMPRHMVADLIESGELVCIWVENFNSRSQQPMYLLKDRRRPLSQMAQSFWQYLVDFSALDKGNAGL